MGEDDDKGNGPEGRDAEDVARDGSGFDAELWQSIANDATIHPDNREAAYRAARRGESEWWLATSCRDPRGGGASPGPFPRPGTVYYTRAAALADGVLIDVSDTARDAGIRYPVAVTRAVWLACVRVPAGVAGQNEAGRLWDVLWMLRLAAQECDESELRFWLHVRKDDHEGYPPLVELKAICGPADDGSPCMTVMMPNED
jgi:hypothetical protein